MPNLQLHAVDESNGSLRLSDFGQEGLNRYSFVWYGLFDELLPNAEKLLTVGGGLFQPFTWFVTAFPMLGDEAFRSKLQLRMREKTGWMTFISASTGIALKQAPPSIHALSIQDREALAAGAVFILGGVEKPLDWEAFMPIEASLRMFAQHGKLAPGKTMLSWLEKQDYQLGYFERSDRDRQGLILITPHKLPLNEITEIGLVEEIYNYPESTDVWVLP